MGEGTLREWLDYFEIILCGFGGDWLNQLTWARVLRGRDGRRDWGMHFDVSRKNVMLGCPERLV
ncbi:hypothetical protein SK128_003850 [Halocaridina rubra]|uniref:Uncharacterized protein n=1 Tax=Halocaridina rubra TaxID=373956 RepID=A0AAN8WMF1_HALRR